MHTLREIKSFYPDNLYRFPRFMLREYLQYKILEIIFDSRYAGELCFLGGHACASYMETDGFLWT